jgi:cysteine desulfuration protein SufE
MNVLNYAWILSARKIKAKLYRELVEDFALFDDWEERYRYLIDLGRALPPMDEALKVENNLVRGCTSRVWLYSWIEDERFHFVADSDAHIVRGLVAILDKVFQGVALSEIAKIDIDGAFEEIGLNQHLSPNRRSGFFSMVERIRSAAQ